MRILVVDDSSAIRLTVTEVLEAAGHVCDQAGDGLEGIKRALGSVYDLVIADIDMPVIDGLKFVARVRSSEKNPSVPVLMLTGRRDLEAVEQAKRLGVHGYLVKPIQPEDLLQRVRDAVDPFGPGPRS